MELSEFHGKRIRLRITAKHVLCLAACVVVLFLCVVIGGAVRGYSPRAMLGTALAVIDSWCSQKTVADRLSEIESRHPELAAAAKSADGELTIFVFKRERKVELHSKGWRNPRQYNMTGFSGELGPKLKEGDGQIPEGVYGVEYLNPNSMFHLSLKVSYPNAFDRAMAKRDGRTELGGDIMIHGGSATVGCIPIGDENIEEVFYLVGKIGPGNVKIIISPYDMRNGRVKELESSAVGWYPSLCECIEKAIQEL